MGVLTVCPAGLRWRPVTTAPEAVEIDVERQLEVHRRELTGYCYRMLGAGSEAEDAVQETLVRAWKASDRFEGRSSVRSWLYRIATNVCLDMLRTPQRRARPMDLGGPVTADSPLAATLPEHAWVQPMADDRILPLEGDPADLATARESVRLAFLAALQHLPPRQRAVLILREVLRWQATEVAELLDTTVASVNSALQRARATLSTLDTGASQSLPVTDDQRAMLDRYVDAFERYDITSLVSLLRDDVVMSMPPYDFWLSGPEEMAKFFVGPGIGCEGSRLLPVQANGMAAFASYRPDPNGGHAPWSIQVLEISGDRIVGHHNFLETSLFEAFGLPAHL